MSRTKDLRLMAVGLVLLLVLLEVVGRLRLLGESWPPLSEVVGYLGDPTARALLGRALEATVSCAVLGFVLGSVVGIGAAVVTLLVAFLRPGLERLAGVANAIPPLALGTLMVSTVGGDGAPTALAALGSGFTMFVAGTSGLEAAASSHHDVFSVLGASRWTRLLRLQLPAAVPLLLDGAALAGSGSIMGAIFGEWFGAHRGIGVLLISAMQNVQIELLWAAALSAALVSLVVFLVISGVRTVAVRRFA